MAVHGFKSFLVANKQHLLHAISLFVISSVILFFKLDYQVAESVVNILDMNGGLDAASILNHHAAICIYGLSLIMVAFAVFNQRRYRIFGTNIVLPEEDEAQQSDEEEVN
ncbi:uncharacterized protein LOC113564583 [Drosophila erecta]|uniref:uncharacterized protein LOC113564583 n=1 Tax=Drosophila erecta TaxID=7220 RepID=UPI0001781024|nr:uncharacterized protein LOC113564583 [Drosophila erecta]